MVDTSSQLDTVPGVCDTISLLARQGYGVDVFTSMSAIYMPPHFGDGVNVFFMRTLPAPAAGLQAKVRSRLSHAGGLLAPAVTGYKKVRAGWRQALEAWHVLGKSVDVWRAHRRQPYACFIGVDPTGLKEAQSLTRFIKVPLIYYSLELLLSNEITSAEHKDLKKHELFLSRQAGFIIIQDQERAALLAEDNQIPMDKFVLLPNAPLGPARRRRSSYWHERFDLPADRRIVLHAGSLKEWTGIKEIVKSVGSWPEEWVLVVHSRQEGAGHPALGELRSLAVAGRTFFSLKPVARQDYDELVDAADIGVAFYMPAPGSPYTQQNIETIGLSSGKISFYLRAGLPVITNKAASIAKIIEAEGCGVAVEGAADLGQAISRISGDYDEMSRRSLKVFDRQLDFRNEFNQVLDRVAAF